MVEHLFHKLANGGLGLVTKRVLSLFIRSIQVGNFTGAEEIGVDFGNHLASVIIGELLINVLATPRAVVETGMLKRHFDELLHGGCLIGGDNEVSGTLGVLVQHLPVGAGVVLRVTPVTNRVDVTDLEVFLEAVLDSGNGFGNFASDEVFMAKWALVVERDGVASEDFVH